MIATQPSPVANATAKPARRPRLGLLRWMRLVGGLAQPAGRGRSVVQGGSSPKLLTENQVLGRSSVYFAGPHTHCRVWESFASTRVVRISPFYVLSAHTLMVE